MKANGGNGKKRKEERVGRIMVNLTQEEYEFIDKIGRDALFSTGKRLTNNKVIRAFVDALKEVRVDGKGLYNVEGLKNRVLIKLGIRDERRQYPRFIKEVKLFWHRIDVAKESNVGEAGDVSTGGFRIELKREYKIGEILEFNIIDPNDVDRPITAYGRVAWVKKRDDDAGLEAGIELTYLIQTERERLCRLLHDAPEKPPKIKRS